MQFLDAFDDMGKPGGVGKLNSESRFTATTKQSATAFIAQIHRVATGDVRLPVSFNQLRRFLHAVAAR